MTKRTIDAIGALMLVGFCVSVVVLMCIPFIQHG